MSNDNTAVKYYDLHTKGAGFLNRFREVKPKPGSGQKFKPFSSVSIGAFRGSSEDIEYTNFDTVIAGTKAREILTQYQKEINDQNTKVIVGFTIGDIFGYTYVTKNRESKEEENRCGIKGRLLKIQFLKIDGEMVYKYEKPTTDDENAEAQPVEAKETPVADSSQEPAPESKVDEPQAPDTEECPFEEQLGNTVTLASDDPDFDKKLAWLEQSDYTFDHQANTWELNQ